MHIVNVMRTVSLIGLFMIIGASLSIETAGQLLSRDCDPPFRIKNTSYFLGEDGKCKIWTVGGSGDFVELAGDSRVSRTISNRDLNSLYVIDNAAAIIVGNRGEILTSMDGGATWEARDSGTQTDLLSVSCRNRGSCAIAGEKGLLLSGPVQGPWIQKGIGKHIDLTDVHFPTETTGYTVGEKGAIFATDDAGNSWRKIDIPFARHRTNFSDGIPTFESVFFRNLGEGCVSGWGIGEGFVACTVDGGDSWKVSKLDGHFIVIVWRRENELFVIDQYGKNYKSTDKGKTWKNTTDLDSITPSSTVNP